MTDVTEFTFKGTLAYPFILDKLNKYGKHSTDFFPASDEDRRAIRETGTRCKVKETKEGKFFYTFTSPGDKKPNVVDSEGNKVTALIGSGSEARIRFYVERFTSPTWGEVTRTVLTDVVIDKLIPYEKKEAPVVAASTSSEEKVSERKMPF